MHTGFAASIAGQLYDPYSGTFQTPADGPARRVSQRLYPIQQHRHIYQPRKSQPGRHALPVTSERPATSSILSPRR